MCLLPQRSLKLVWIGWPVPVEDSPGLRLILWDPMGYCPGAKQCGQLHPAVSKLRRVLCTLLPCDLIQERGMARFLAFSLDFTVVHL